MDISNRSDKLCSESMYISLLITKKKKIQKNPLTICLKTRHLVLFKFGQDESQGAVDGTVKLAMIHPSQTTKKVIHFKLMLWFPIKMVLQCHHRGQHSLLVFKYVLCYCIAGGFPPNSLWTLFQQWFEEFGTVGSNSHQRNIPNDLREPFILCTHPSNGLSILSEVVF